MTSLNIRATELWATPRAGKLTDEDEIAWRERNDRGEVATMPLTLQAKLWATPMEDDANNAFDRESGARQSLARDAVNTWPTPTAAPEAPNTNSNQKTGEPSLGAAATGWRTPSGRDWKGESAESWRTRDTGDLTPTLADQVCSLPDPTNTTPGAPSSSGGPASRRQLNPIFVTWLMGWPVWWALPEPIELTLSGSPETAWSLYRRRMRGALSALDSRSN